MEIIVLVNTKPVTKAVKLCLTLEALREGGQIAPPGFFWL